MPGSRRTRRSSTSATSPGSISSSAGGCRCALRAFRPTNRRSIRPRSSPASSASSLRSRSSRAARAGTRSTGSPAGSALPAWRRISMPPTSRTGKSREERSVGGKRTRKLLVRVTQEPPEESAPVLVLDEQLLELAPIEEDAPAGRALFDFDSGDRLDRHVVAALGTLAPVRFAELFGRRGLLRALCGLALLARRLDHLRLVLTELVVLAPLADLFGVPGHARILDRNATAAGPRARRTPRSSRRDTSRSPVSEARDPTPSPCLPGSPGRRAPRPRQPEFPGAARGPCGTPSRAPRRKPVFRRSGSFRPR